MRPMCFLFVWFFFFCFVLFCLALLTGNHPLPPSQNILRQFLSLPFFLSFCFLFFASLPFLKPREEGFPHHLSCAVFALVNYTPAFAKTARALWHLLNFYMTFSEVREPQKICWNRPMIREGRWWWGWGCWWWVSWLWTSSVQPARTFRVLSCPWL